MGDKRGKRKENQGEREKSVRPGLEMRTDSKDEGVFSGYITTWDTVDSYNSVFVRGCFKKTIQERGDRIKVLDNHGNIVGKVLEIREDDVGCWVKAQLTMGVERARDTFEFIRSGAYDTLSFGFKTINDKYKNGVRNITEVKLYEVSPVVFEANEKAEITDFREERDEDFNVTLKENDLLRRGWQLLSSLDETLMDIWWSYELTSDGTKEKIDEAIAAFHAEYLSWANEFISTFWDNENRSMPTNDQFLIEFRESIGDKSLETVAAETSFTVTELRSLKQGKILPPATSGKLEELSPELRKAHAARRKEILENLCTEIRAGGLTAAESSRLSALLEIRKSDDGGEVDTLMNALDNLSFKTK